ncbi:energy transducer TonB [Flammeovirgaceae bacterium SG7u.111]|nr:energy transducer TonB [Flammeovirgaceae bacterium SG7u.132]WPO34680.1 energy transducer TonB [Flammeovirgaceae bacterium SG7u.111]
MLRFLDSIGMLGIILIFVLLVIGTILILRSIINKKTEKIISEGKDGDYLTKKYYSVDNHKYRGLVRNVGLALSLGLVLAAFEMPDFDDQELVDLGTLDAEMEEMMEIPPTEQKPPPPPKIQAPEIIEVPDEEEIEEEIEVDLDMEADEETVIEEVVMEEPEEVEEEVADQIFEIVEEGAEPDGGMVTFLKWVGKNVKYPNQAKRMGVEGKVYVQFVVDKDGSLTDVKVIRGIGAGCDEEAIRVLQKAKKWKPGKQRGRAVKQRIVLPVNFKLG